MTHSREGWQRLTVSASLCAEFPEARCRLGGREFPIRRLWIRRIATHSKRFGGGNSATCLVLLDNVRSCGGDMQHRSSAGNTGNGGGGWGGLFGSRG